jgi:hypothetical protein
VAVAEQDGLSAVELGLLLAGRCVVELWAWDGAAIAIGTGGAAAELSVGDREAVLLRLRQQALGDRVALVASCPDLACGQPMDLDVTLSSVLCAPVEDPETEVPIRRGLILRRPTGADQLAVADLTLDDPDRAALELLRRCVVTGELGDADIEAACEAFDRADPQAGCNLALTCPTCSARFTSPLDAADLLRRELGSERELDVAVHLLAYHYHWTEDAILGLPVARRRRYIQMLNDAFGAVRGTAV